MHGKHILADQNAHASFHDCHWVICKAQSGRKWIKDKTLRAKRGSWLDDRARLWGKDDRKRAGAGILSILGKVRDCTVSNRGGKRLGRLDGPAARVVKGTHSRHDADDFRPVNTCMTN